MNTPDPSGLTQRQAAKQLKWSIGKVNQAVASGILRRLANGRIDPTSLASALVDAPTLSAPAGATYAIERTALIAAQRQRQEMDNHVRRGELIERRAVAAVIPPAARRYRDMLLQLVRDGVTNETERAVLLARITAATETFIAESVPQSPGNP